MNDADPYRYRSGDGEPASDAASLGAYRPSDRPPHLSPRQIRRLAFDREAFVWSMAVVALATFGIFAIFRVRSLGFLSLDDKISWFMPTYYLLHVPAAIFAYRTYAWINPSRLAVAMLACLACVPFLDFAIALLILQESKKVLERHGIEAGFLRVDRRRLPGPDAEQSE